MSDQAGERLQKVLAAAGVGSRRECEQLILDGRVEVDRKIVTKLGTRIDPDKQKIRVDGVALKPRKTIYYMVNKPPGVLSTNRDPEGRLRVVDLLDTEERLFTVGRLDKSSEGLILVTNDGDLANRLTHPRYGIEKTYVVQVAGSPSKDDLDSLQKGVRLAEGVARVARLKVRKRHKSNSTIEMVLNEGRNREIRRLLARIGHKVTQLKRIAVGPLKLGELPSGAHRQLTNDEVRQLRKAVTGQKPSRKKRSTKGTPFLSKTKSGSKKKVGKRPKKKTVATNTRRQRGNAKKKPRKGRR